MGRTVTVRINHDGNPAFNQRVQDLVKAIFESCFASLEEDTVVIVWSSGKKPKGKLGKDKSWNPTTWDFNLGGTLNWPGNNGQTGDDSVNVNPKRTAADAAAAGGDPDVSLANTICHEIGLHGIAGDAGHARSEGGSHNVDRVSNTPELCHGPGQWSRDVCEEMKDELDVS